LGHPKLGLADLVQPRTRHRHALETVVLADEVKNRQQGEGLGHQA
jgi:hypothetical protein